MSQRNLNSHEQAEQFHICLFKCLAVHDPIYIFRILFCIFLSIYTYGIFCKINVMFTTGSMLHYMYFRCNPLFFLLQYMLNLWFSKVLAMGQTLKTEFSGMISQISVCKIAVCDVWTRQQRVVTLQLPVQKLLVENYLQKI